MCLNCGAINGDLPAQDHGFWLNVFRLEQCPAGHSTEELSYEAVDDEYHNMTILDIAHCPMCGERQENTAIILEQHVYTPEVIDPTCLSGGYTIYTCELCGYSYQDDRTEAAGHQFRDWIIDQEPTADNAGSHHRECLVCGDVETELLPPLKPDPEPKPEPEPTSEPEPTPGPEPTPEPEPTPGPRPTPEPESKPKPTSIRHNAYITGLPDGTFEPSRPMTRAEVAAIFARLLAEKHEKTLSTKKHVFIDVPADAWYADQVDYLASLGVVCGRCDDCFAPNDPITRAEFTAMAVRAFGTYTGQAGNMLKYTVFLDIPDGHWAAGAIQSAAELGWFSGDENGLFHPDDPILRAEGITVLNRILQRQADQAYITIHLTELKTFTDIDPNHWAWYDIMEAANNHTASGQQESWSR